MLRLPPTTITLSPTELKEYKYRRKHAEHKSENYESTQFDSSSAVVSTRSASAVRPQSISSSSSSTGDDMTDGHITPSSDGTINNTVRTGSSENEFEDTVADFMTVNPPLQLPGLGLHRTNSRASRVSTEHRNGSLDPTESIAVDETFLDEAEGLYGSEINEEGSSRFAPPSLLPPPFSSSARISTSTTADPVASTPFEMNILDRGSRPLIATSRARSSSPSSRTTRWSRRMQSLSIRVRRLALAREDRETIETETTAPESMRMGLYDDRLPTSSQPQTPRQLPEFRHQSRVDGAYTAPVRRDERESSERGRRTGRIGSPVGLRTPGFQGLYGGMENASEEETWVLGPERE